MSAGNSDHLRASRNFTADDFGGGHGRGKSVDRLGSDNGHQEEAPGKRSNLHRQLSKSKSMEYLKAKLLSRKSSNASSSSKRDRWVADDHGGDASSRMRSASPVYFGNVERNFPRGRADAQARQEYDWRQDTPFWNKQGRWARPAPKKATSTSTLLMEEPWVNHHHHHAAAAAAAFPLPFAITQPPQPHLPAAGVKHHPLNGGNRVPGAGWAPGLANRKAYAFGSSPAAPPSVSLGAPNLYLPSHFVSAPRPFVSPDSAHSNSSSSSGRGSGGGGLTRLSPEDAAPLSSRLEITELSDEEPGGDGGCPTPDYGSTVVAPGSTRSNFRRSGNKRNILDMPSGLY